MNDEERREEKYISEPDKNGVRYFNVSSGRYDAKYGNRGNRDEAGSYDWNNKKDVKGRRLWKNLSVFLIIVLIVALVGAIGMMGVNRNLDTSVAGIKTPGSEYIATLYVEGTIQDGNTDYFGRASGYQHQWTMDAIDDLMYDDSNMGIILFVNSPGGTIYESDELYLKLCEYKENTERPVYAVMGSMAASGGYYISAPSDKIFANRNTWTGSIGVTIGTIMDFSEFLENSGIKSKTITSGEHKAMGSNLNEMTAEEEAIWRSLVDEAYEQFVEVVADGRNMDITNVKAIADGRIYSAKQAIDVGLVDELGDIDSAYYDMMDTYELGYCDLIDITYPNSTSFNWLLGLLNLPNKSADSEASMLLELANSQGAYPASYMCEALGN